jgi:hypothetical protein
MISKNTQMKHFIFFPDVVFVVCFFIILNINVKFCVGKSLKSMF